MFGLFRYMLACCVAISHLWSGMVGGPAAYAVWGFYCLSGFLMTLVLNEKYEYSPKGVATFLAHRALRIYPSYFAVCLGMAALFLAIPATAYAFLPNLQMPPNRGSWLYTLTLLTPPAGGELVHGSSALRVELWYYLFMATGIVRNRSLVVAWFAASFAYVVYLILTKVGFAERYVLIAPCSLAFSTGSMLYHFRDWFPKWQSLPRAVTAFALWWLHVWLSWRLPGGPWVYGLYTSLIASGIVILALMRLEARQMPLWLSRLDRLAGDLSYPMYLCHWGVGVCLAWLVSGWSRATLPLFLAAFPVVNVVAYLVHRMVEKPLGSLRSRQRPSEPGPTLTPEPKFLRRNSVSPTSSISARNG